MKYVFLFLLLFCSCTTERVVTNYDTIVRDRYVTNYQTDTIYEKTFVKEYLQADTVYRCDSVFKYVSRNVHDTLILRDTVIDKQIIIKEEKEQKKGVSWLPMAILGLIGIILGLYFIIRRFLDLCGR